MQNIFLIFITFLMYNTILSANINKRSYELTMEEKIENREIKYKDRLSQDRIIESKEKTIINNTNKQLDKRNKIEAEREEKSNIIKILR